ncbi:MAG: hypothetical protein ACKOBP_10930 [Planctomycetia bacterium]
MNVFVFEDHVASRLGVLTAARPACDLTIGTATLHDSLAAFGSVHRVLGRIWHGTWPPSTASASPCGAARVIDPRLRPHRGTAPWPCS